MLEPFTISALGERRPTALGRLAAIVFALFTLPSSLLAAGSSDLDSTEVTFSSHGVDLAGVVLSPIGDAPRAGMVVIHGSGPSDRNQAWAAAFARGLAERGFSVLLPDKRGSGESGGDWRRASFEVLADDAIAAVEALTAFGGVDPGRVGVIGLSQGGHIAPLAASRSDAIAFVMSISASTVPITEQVVDEVEKLARRQGFTDEQIERVNALHRLAIHYGLTAEGWEAYEESLARALESDLAGHGVVEPFPRDPGHWVWTWARIVGPYDPLPHWQALEVPAVIAYGARDTQLHVDESVDLLLGLTSDQAAPRAILIFSDSGHGLRDPRTHRIRPDLLDFLGSWVSGH